MKKKRVVVLTLIVISMLLMSCAPQKGGSDPSGPDGGSGRETVRSSEEMPGSSGMTGGTSSGSAPEETSVLPTEAVPSTTSSPAVPKQPFPAQVFAWQLAEGTYPIHVTSSSSMFRVTDAQLTVRGGAMTAVLTLSGQGYGKLFMGTGEQALAAGTEAGIPFVPDQNGAKTFTVPVKALNAETDCAAWSIRKEKWYDRVLVFESGQIPRGAYVSSSLADGEYSVGAVLSGGTGRAGVESPLKLVVRDGKAAARIIWSSPNYELVRIQEIPFLPVQREGNSTFWIPAVLDVEMMITGRTVAMSEPHDIDYVLWLDASTLKPFEGETP